MSGTIRIENLTRKHLQYRIDHQAVCVKVGKCFCVKGRRGSMALTIHVAPGVGKKTVPFHQGVMLTPKIIADSTGPKPKIKLSGNGVVSNTAKAKVAEVPAVVAAPAVAEAPKDEADTEEPKSKKGSGRRGKN